MDIVLDHPHLVDSLRVSMHAAVTLKAETGWGGGGVLAEPAPR